MSQDRIARFEGQAAFLSNFWAHPQLGIDGYTYPTAEHAFQAAKTTDTFAQKRVRAASTPGQAKKIGRTVPLREDWEDVKLDVMERIVRAKFAIPALRERLLDTGTVELVEGNNWNDTFWGVCRGRGSNHLGLILMKVRSDIREGEA